MSEYILGISAFYHDSAAALLKDGEIAAAAQEERFTRKKHDHSFPQHAVSYCLKEAGITANDLAYVAFYEKPFIKFNRILETYLSAAPLGIRSFLMAIPLWLKQKLWISDVIRKNLSCEAPILFSEHHEAHAASAFFPSPFKRAAILTVDGVGEWATSTIGIGSDDQIQLIAEQHFPHSLGLLYSAFTYFTGFKVNSGEYKLMGLAPYGEPRYVRQIFDELIDLKDDGSFKLNLSYFNFVSGLTMTNRRFARLFGGPPRKPESPLTQREMDLARSVQEATNEIVLRMAKHAKQISGEKHLCLAGGVALNCVANAKLLKSGLFDDLWIQPAAGDAGGALGAAYLVRHHYLKHPRIVKGKNDRQKNSYLGPSFSDREIQSFLDEAGARYELLNERELIEQAAQHLSEGKVVGWFQGRLEFGPRALGNRSILGDPRKAEMQQIMNLKIKFRESFRPFAPSVLEEDASEWFEIDRPSPYMLLVADVHPDKRLNGIDPKGELQGLDRLKIQRSVIPAVTHVDYSARLQTVNQNSNPLFYRLLKSFKEKTDCPVLINTSFNVRGEPIVATPQDAYSCFLRTQMDILILGRFLLKRESQPEKPKIKVKKEVFELD
ncbi:MAG: carbamoyltransferase [Calditrichaeota bacterium]|nr:carbamoyltransferase [Calditrichota bacterium]